MNIGSTNSQPQIDEEISKRLQDLNTKFQEQVDKGEEIETNEDIIKNVHEIVRMKKSKEMRKLKIIDSDKYIRTFIQKFKNFHMSFPSIFNSIMDNDDFEVKRLTDMLSMRKRIQDKKISNFDASVKISTQYTDEFIKKPLNLK